MRDELVKNFLHRHNMAAEGIELLTETGGFLAAMRYGLQGKTSSLLMLPTYIDCGGAAPRGQTALALDAGGTNLRAAVVRFDENGTGEVKCPRRTPMPGTGGAIECDEFFDAIAAIVAGYKTPRVGFCFSFPAEILPDGDARILALAKEVEIKNAAGRLLGDGVNASLASHILPKRRFTILNDTVATLLAGIAAGGDRGGYIGFILGTGTNACYIEKTSEITKIADTGGSMPVNIESGCYSGFPRGDFDRELDAASANPGDHLTEKMIGGAYLGELISRTLHGAMHEGLFPGARLEPGMMFKTADISAFLEGEGPLMDAFVTDGERDYLRLIIHDCYERAARIVAVMFAAIMTQTGEGHDPRRPVRIIAEGTTFEKSAIFREKLERLQREFLCDKLGFHCEITTLPNAVLLGTGMAALLKK